MKLLVALFLWKQYARINIFNIAEVLQLSQTPKKTDMLNQRKIVRCWLCNESHKISLQYKK